MENIKKKIKYYFPYKLFDIEKRSKSQLSLIKNIKVQPLTAPFNLKNKVGIFNYSKKLKSTILSSKIFSSYMENYTGQTQDYCFKSPSNTFYPIKKNYHLLPINAKNSLEENKTTNDNTTNIVVEKPYGYKYKKTRIYINNKKGMLRSASEKLSSKFFMNFSEGQHYHKIIMETFGLKNIDIINCKNVIKDNFNYLQGCLKELNSIENFIGEKEFEFKIKNFGQEICFYMKIFSICLKFYEISEEKEENKNNNHDKKKLYIPFKLLPLFYLLDYSDFKNFLSEIIYFDEKSDSLNIKYTNLSQFIKKYSYYIKNIFAKKDDDYIKNISFYKNEFLFQRNYDWIVSDNNENNKKHIYKLKISFPKVIFETKTDKIKIVNHLNKNILLQVLKKNFIDWEKLILFDLFGLKKFRNIINNILIGGDKYKNCKIKLYEHFDKKENSENKINNNYEFFMSEIIRNKSYYYIFNPNIILLLSGSKYKYFQRIELTLLESKIMYEIAKYWGIINTLLKCMYKDEEKNKIYFKINVLKDFPKLSLKKSKNINNSQDDIFSKEKNINIEIDKYLQYKTKSLEILITECLLKTIHITKNEKATFYYKMPKELYKTILTTNNNHKIVINILQNFKEIISQEQEINISEEEEKMIEKSEKTLRSPFTLDKYNLFKKPAFKAMKSTPLKTFNKLKTTKLATDKFKFGSDYLKSFGKKNSILKKNKSSKDSDKKKTAKVSRFIVPKDSMSDINKNLENIKDYERDIHRAKTNIKNKEDIKGDLRQINDEEKLRKFRFTKKYTINYG